MSLQDSHLFGRRFRTMLLLSALGVVSVGCGFIAQLVEIRRDTLQNQTNRHPQKRSRVLNELKSLRLRYARLAAKVGRLNADSARQAAQARRFRHEAQVLAKRTQELTLRTKMAHRFVADLHAGRVAPSQGALLLDEPRCSYLKGHDSKWLAQYASLAKMKQRLDVLHTEQERLRVLNSFAAVNALQSIQDALDVTDLSVLFAMLPASSGEGDDHRLMAVTQLLAAWEVFRSSLRANARWWVPMQRASLCRFGEALIQAVSALKLLTTTPNSPKRTTQQTPLDEILLSVVAVARASCGLVGLAVGVSDPYSAMWRSPKLVRHIFSLSRLTALGGRSSAVVLVDWQRLLNHALARLAWSSHASFIPKVWVTMQTSVIQRARARIRPLLNACKRLDVSR